MKNDYFLTRGSNIFSIHNSKQTNYYLSTFFFGLQTLRICPQDLFLQLHQVYISNYFFNAKIKKKIINNKNTYIRHLVSSIFLNIELCLQPKTYSLHYSYPPFSSDSIAVSSIFFTVNSLYAPKPFSMLSIYLLVI